MKNGAELVLMGANPDSRGQVPGRRGGGRHKNPYDALSRDEKLAFGRLGLGKKHLRNPGDIESARRKVRDVSAFRNRFPNPSASALETASADFARELRAGFAGKPSNRFRVFDEPHVPAGDYADCGEFIALGVKPMPGGETAAVQELSFPGRSLELVANASGDQLFIVGGATELDAQELKLFTRETGDRVELGAARFISYAMRKFGDEVPTTARGADIRWDHEFGEEGGTCPRVWYDAAAKRLVLGQASYRIEGAWIRN